MALSQGEAPTSGTLRLWALGFVAFMLLLAGMFVTLGAWQLQRLEAKRALTEAVETRLHLPPLTLPPVAEWVGLDRDVFNFRSVTVTGHFVLPETVLVFTSLSDARGQYSGPGYWVMTPFVLETGGVVFVNRGFVPERLGAAQIDGATGTLGNLTLTGIARLSETANTFTPGPEAARRIEWVRDTTRLAALIDPALAPVADLYIDLPASDPGALPQGGETVVEFSNRHFEYALTWFAFAVITVVMLIFWATLQPRSKSRQSNLP